MCTLSYYLSLKKLQPHHQLLEYALKLPSDIRAENLKRYWFSYIPNFEYTRIYPTDISKAFIICTTSITTMIEKDQGVSG